MSHYFSKNQEGKTIPFFIDAILRKKPIRIYSASGIFSARRIDRGSKLLLEHADLPKKGSVLDLGCGNGVVGIALSLDFPTLQFTLVDINKRAVSIAKKNISSGFLTKFEIWPFWSIFCQKWPILA